MSLVDILKAQSVWTYDIMAATADLGEMIREDALTSVNLAQVQSMANQQGIALGTTSLQGAKLEAEFGGDWIWNYDGATLLVQAKKLDAIKGQNFASYTINIDQLKILMTNCTDGYFSDAKAIPLYVFYNTFIDDDHKDDVGCIMIHAKTLWTWLCTNGQSDQKTATVSPTQMKTAGAGPWWQIFSS
ncbi:hypothetical protein E1180_09595 [Roseibium denhamense]|uniref:Uncharacterized protein n=1 Tax=Roseibium denhamense TaxID=76305 RepID=A0ABY1PNA7_9HYPH|nr:hypothetical protein [Roseibium denhamense]MTI05769.1 hypothetical protein [Roseibium denhamense]SMP37001.1 hypothetical protein SAMN06265374_4438 [Roseibium denhamense]